MRWRPLGIYMLICPKVLGRSGPGTFDTLDLGSESKHGQHLPALHVPGPCAPSPYLVGGPHFGRFDIVPHELLGGGGHLLGALSNGVLPEQGHQGRAFRAPLGIQSRDASGGTERIHSFSTISCRMWTISTTQNAGAAGHRPERHDADTGHAPAVPASSCRGPAGGGASRIQLRGHFSSCEYIRQSQRNRYFTETKRRKRGNQRGWKPKPFRHADVTPQRGFILGFVEN